MSCPLFKFIIMKGFIVVRGFLHDKQYMAGDKIDINDSVNKALEVKGLIKWIDRPEIIMPKTKKKKYVRKSKK